MSRIAKSTITMPKGVDLVNEGGNVTVSGPKGRISFSFSKDVSVKVVDSLVSVDWDQENKKATAQAGTVRSIVNNMVTGVSKGFEVRLVLVGVGYRAQAKDNILNLSLGFSHPIEFVVPAGIDVSTPTQTEIVINGIDKQIVGQVAANIRSYRPPEPYKGKGVRYSDENVVRKEAKKK